MNNSINDILKTIFEKALELNRIERENYFRSLSEDEKKYISEVKSLIASFESADDFLETPTNKNQIFLFDRDQTHPLLGKHLGQYLIEEVIGSGGMGIVFVGKRDDKEFDQKVAIKILKQGLTSKYLVYRFETERQILAKLQHPNIAKLFDGGKTEDGLPYVVMEYIEGVPITEYCENKKLDIKSRLKLFILVCDAVQYAHQNLIVHRDIKPGNILVNKQRRPKLLDFGVAKLLDETIMQKNINLTKTKMWHLTPEYASPEQINGDAITTSSDIYSLGVLLYQVLTGFQPYLIKNISPVAISKIVTEDRIIKPSEIYKSNKSPNELNSSDEINKKLSNTLKGDLDNIILKAMHKDPGQRYKSVQEFSDDINRYLTGLPITARKDTITYRVSKFVNRHRIGVALFVLFNLIVLFSISAIIYQGRIAAKERDKANIENKKFVKVNSFLQEMLSSVDPTEIGRDVKVYDILEKAAKNVNTELKDQPEIEAAIRSTLGNTYVNLGEYKKGKPLLDSAYNINLSLYGENSKETAESIHDLALYYDWTGDYKIADSLYGKSVIILRKVLKKPTERFADVLSDYGIVKMYFEKYNKADKLFTEAIDIALSTYGEKNRNTAVIMNNFALNLTDEGKLDEAEKYYKKSLAILIELLGENRPEVGTSYNNLAYLYMIKKDYKLAEEYINKSYRLKLKLKGKDHPDVGLALNNLGVINFKMKNYSKSEKYLKDAIVQYRKSFSPDHPQIALSQYWLGKIYLETGRLGKSKAYLTKSLRTRIKKLPKENKDIWRSKAELGICLLKQKKYKYAEKFLPSTLNYYKKNFASDTEPIKRLYKNTIKLYESLGDSKNLIKYSQQFKSFSPEPRK